MQRHFPQQLRVRPEQGEPEHLQRRPGGAVTNAAPVTGAASAPYPAGTRQAQCTECRVGLIPFRPGDTVVPCPNCNTPHQIGPGEEQTEAPPVEQPPPEPTIRSEPEPWSTVNERPFGEQQAAEQTPEPELARLG